MMRPEGTRKLLPGDEASPPLLLPRLPGRTSHWSCDCLKMASSLKAGQPLRRFLSSPAASGVPEALRAEMAAALAEGGLPFALLRKLQRALREEGGPAAGESLPPPRGASAPAAPSREGWAPETAESGAEPPCFSVGQRQGGAFGLHDSLPVAP